MHDRVRLLTASILVILMLAPTPARAYSVLTHEEIVDMAWKDTLAPMIKQRFPSVTADQLKEAHAYAYGGAVVQDLGYYPFGSQYFSDLVHYVRSGDFVRNLLKDAQDPNEYAFALGALAHYASDISGHPAVNRATALEYPDLAAKLGPVITYEQNKPAHIKTEFGFDVVQVAKQRFAFDQYHSFIGFKVSKPLLERAFQQTYGLPLDKVLTHEDLAFGTFRWSVSKVIPEMTKVALATRGKKLMAEYPDFDRAKFLYRVSRADYERDWGKQYQRPGIGARILAVLLKLVPHVGPFKALAYKDPTPQTEDMYFKSVNQTIDRYHAYLKQIAESPNGTIKLDDRDFDTGKATEPGEYRLTDDTHAKLVRDLATASGKNGQQLDAIPADLRTYLLNYYADPHAKDFAARHKDSWRKTLNAVERLREQKVASVGDDSKAGRL